MRRLFVMSHKIQHAIGGVLAALGLNACVETSRLPYAEGQGERSVAWQGEGLGQDALELPELAALLESGASLIGQQVRVVGFLHRDVSWRLYYDLADARVDGLMGVGRAIAIAELEGPLESLQNVRVELSGRLEPAEFQPLQSDEAAAGGNLLLFMPEAKVDLVLSPEVELERGGFVSKATAYSSWTEFREPGDPNSEWVAVLVGGGYDALQDRKRYWNDLMMWRNFLVGECGLDPKKDIRLIYNDGLTPSRERKPGLMRANEPNLMLQLNAMASRLREGKGKLLVVVVGHGAGAKANESVFDYSFALEDQGGSDEGDEAHFGHLRGAVYSAGSLPSRFNDPLWFDEYFSYYDSNDQMIDESLGAAFSASPLCSNAYIVLCPCFSGGAIRDLRRASGATLASCSEYQYAYAIAEENFTQFGYLLVAALAGAPPLSPSTGELPVVLELPAMDREMWEDLQENHSGWNQSGPEVSIADAFRFASYWGRYRQTSQVDGNADGHGFQHVTPNDGHLDSVFFGGGRSKPKWKP